MMIAGYIFFGAVLTVAIVCMAIDTAKQSSMRDRRLRIDYKDAKRADDYRDWLASFRREHKR